jgi:hypothetical protein
MQIEKRPRHWAAEIAALPTKEERQQRLNEVPPHFREIVKKHLEIFIFIQRHRS